MLKTKFIEILKNNERDIALLKDKTKNVVFFGAGNKLSANEKCIMAEKIRFDGIVDNDPKKIGKEVLGKKVTPASEIANDYGKECLALIVTGLDKTYRVMAEQMFRGGSCLYRDRKLYPCHAHI